MTREEKIKFIDDKCRKMRVQSLDMALHAGSAGAHFGPGYSIMEIVATLYFAIMKHDPKNPHWDERDRFVLSKGHGVLALYNVLAECGYFPVEELPKFETNDHFLAGHPSMDIDKGIEISSGSLGNGLAVAVGMAAAAKRLKKDFNVYCVVGDGECDEGLIWEAAMMAAHYSLDNIVAVIDRNNYQNAGPSREIMFLGDLAQKWRAFGWFVKEVDGHDPGQLMDALDFGSRAKGKPYAIIAHTIKGKGVSFMENTILWHHKGINAAEHAAALQELQCE